MQQNTPNTPKRCTARVISLSIIGFATIFLIMNAIAQIQGLNDVCDDAMDAWNDRNCTMGNTSIENCHWNFSVLNETTPRCQSIALEEVQNKKSYRNGVIYAGAFFVIAALACVITIMCTKKAAPVRAIPLPQESPTAADEKEVEMSPFAFNSNA